MNAWSEEEIYLLMERAHSLATQGLYSDAAQIFAGVLALEPANRYARTALVSLLLILRDPGAALAFAEEGLRVAPADAELRAWRAETLMVLGRLGEAQRELRWLQASGSDAAAGRMELMLGAGEAGIGPATFGTGRPD